MRHQPLNNSSTGNNLTPNNSLLIQNRIYTESSLIQSFLTSSQWIVSLFLFLGSYLITTKIWNDGHKRLKQQTSYSSVQVKQTDLL